MEPLEICEVVGPEQAPDGGSPRRCWTDDIQNEKPHVANFLVSDWHFSVSCELPAYVRAFVGLAREGDMGVVNISVTANHKSESRSAEWKGVLSEYSDV